MNGKYLSNLRFADDIILMSDNPEDPQKMINELTVECSKAGLQANENKTKVMTNATKTPIHINGEIIEYVEDFIYLGQLVSFNRREEKEISRRITNGWRQFWEVKPMLDSNISNVTKKYIFDSTVLPVLTYGSQTWTNNVTIKSKLSTTQRAMERSMLRIRRSQRIRNVNIRSWTGFEDVVWKTRKLKWDWAGHFMRKSDDRWSKECTEWTPLSGTRRVGRQPKRWRDELHAFDRLWFQKTHNGNEWKSMEEAFARA